MSHASTPKILDQAFERLSESGAHEIEPSFRVATGDQHEVAFGDQRFLLVDKNQYSQYAQTMNSSGVDYLDSVEEIEDAEGVVMVEIPRDGRNLVQVALSASAHNRTISPSEIFQDFGKVISTIAKNTDRMPTEQSILLRSVLYGRAANQIYLTPSVDFTKASEVQKNRIAESVFSQLTSVNAFDRADLFNSFMDGVE